MIASGELVMVRAKVLSTYWPDDTSEGKYAQLEVIGTMPGAPVRFMARISELVKDKRTKVRR